MGKQQMTEKPKKITLPDIEGVQIPRYVRQLASGQHNRLTRNVSFGEMDEKINVLHNELTSLAQTDVMLIEKFLNLFNQLNTIKTELKDNEEPKVQKHASTRSAEDKRKYAAKRVDIPSSSSRSSIKSSLSESSSRDKDLGASIQSRLSTNMNFIRVDSTRSLASLSQSTVDEDEIRINEGGFDTISMPKEGELSNLDINWFINYSTDSYPNPQT